MKNRRILIVVATILVIVLSLLLMTVYVLPAVLKSKIPSLIQQETGRKASLDKFELTYFPLTINAGQLAIKEKNGLPFASIQGLFIKINAVESIKQSTLIIEQLDLVKPYVHIAKFKNAEFNFSDLSKDKEKTEPEDNKIFPVSIAQLALTGGEFVWEDDHLAKPAQETISQINFNVDKFSTVSKQKARLHLSLSLKSGGNLDWQGNLGITPLSSEGKLELEKLNIKNLLALVLPDNTTFSIDSTAKLASDYKMSFQDHHLQLNSNKTQIQLDNFKFEQTGTGKQQLSVQKFSHDTDFSLSVDEQDLQFAAKKSISSAQDLQFSGLEPNTLSVKIANINHDTDFQFSHDINGWKFISNKSKFNLDNMQLAHAGQGVSLNLEKLSHQTDFNISQDKNGWHMNSDKSRLDMDKAQLSHAGQGISLDLEKLSHESDFNISQDKNTWHMSSRDSKFDLDKVQFSRAGQDKLSVSAGKLSQVTDYQASFSPENWQLSINKNKLTATDAMLEQTKAGIKTSAIELEAGLKADNAGKKLKLTVSQGLFTSHDFQLTEHATAKTLIKLPLLAVKGIGLNLENQELTVDSIAANDADFVAWLNAEGIINYQSLVSSPKTRENAPALTATAQTQEKTPAPAQSGKLWSIKVKQLALSNFGLDFEDRSLAKPVSMSARPINFKLTDYNSQAGTKLPLQLDIVFNKSGSIKIQGNTVIEPFSTQLNLDIKDIALDKFQPYLDKLARLDLIDGDLNLKGDLSIDLQNKDNPEVKFKGNTDIAKFLTRDQTLHKDFIKWDDLRLNDLDVDLSAKRYKAKTLVINKPYARLTIKKDKTINFADVFAGEPKSSDKSAKTAGSPVKKDKPKFYLDKVQIIDGSSDFSDLSLILPFSAQIKSLDGGASGISSEQNSKVKVSLKGNAYDLAPVDIEGDISPYLGDFNMALNFDGMPMPLVTPYMVQFAGYKVEKGKMSLGLKYNLDKGELNASNSVAIDQFELGEKVENPKAVSLPLELAVTLLKDSYGRIKVDVPITGSLNDPKFSVGHVIADALVNVITKAVTSPFRAIASLIGSEEDLSTISFEPGKSTLDKKQLRKLTDLARALKERPILSLEIKGAAYEEQDWPTLRENALYDQLKILKANELNKNSTQKTLPEYVQISYEDYKRLLTQLFFEQFPLLAKKNLFGTPSLLDPKGGDFYEVAKQKLAIVISPQQERLKDLATKRAQAIANYVVQQGSVSNDRVYILDSVIDPERKGADIMSFLSLKSK